MLDLSWVSVRNTVGHLHPSLVHFPVALLLTGLGLEAWQTVRKQGASAVGRVLLVVGLAGALAAVISGLSLYHPEDYRERTLAVVTIHRTLGLATAASALLAAITNGIPGRLELRGGRLMLYRVAFVITGLLAGVTGHYGGWVVFGWGTVWTF